MNSEYFGGGRMFLLYIYIYSVCIPIRYNFDDCDVKFVDYDKN